MPLRPLLLLCISLLAGITSYAQPCNRVAVSNDPAIRQVFTPLDSMRIAYAEFDAQTGVLLKSGQLLRFHVDSTAQVEDPVTHVFHLVKDTTRNVIDGTWTEYYASGKKRLECVFRDRAIDGIYTTWFENGNIDSTGYLTSQRKLKSWDYYYADGKKRRHETYENAPSWQVGLYFSRVDFYPDGSVKQAEQFDTDGNRTGEFFAFYPGNKLKEYGTFRHVQKMDRVYGFMWYDEIKSGLWITFDELEKIMSMENFDEQGKSI